MKSLQTAAGESMSHGLRRGILFRGLCGSMDSSIESRINGNFQKNQESLGKIGFFWRSFGGDWEKGGGRYWGIGKKESCFLNPELYLIRGGRKETGLCPS